MGHPTPGASLLVRGEVPIGAGLSSSAAIEVASALALMSLNGARLSLPEVAKLCQRAENVFIGARVGIMDQFVSCLGRAGHALLLDCRSLEFKLIPIPENVRLVICNTMVKHEHASGAYNRRREECDEGVKILSEWYPQCSCSERHFRASNLSSTAPKCPPPSTSAACTWSRKISGCWKAPSTWQQGDVGRFGSLMRESHLSLRDLFEVSCRELDIMVEIAESLEGYCGGRMTGGGFGGCTVNLVKSRRCVRICRADLGTISGRHRDQT